MAYTQNETFIKSHRFFAECRTESVACPISIGGMEAVLKQFGFYTI